MSSTCGNRIRYEVLRSLNFGDISGSYTGVGTPFANPIRILKVCNATDANLIISFNGVDQMDFIAANGFCLYDFSSNRADPGGYLEQSAGDRLYVAQESATPTSGNVYVTVIYAATS